MNYKDNQFITAQDLSFVGVLHDIKKSKSALQPIFECFTNALEAIKIKQTLDAEHKGEILLKINASELTIQSTEFNSLSISDNGIGFNEDEFKRFNTFKLTTKGFKNLGSGRIQYVHYFDTTRIKSMFEKDGKFFEIVFSVSKKEDFLKNNAIVKHISSKETTESISGTTVSFSTLLENSGIYNDLNEQTLKDKLLEKYIHYFCYNKNKLPKIKIEFYVQSELKGESTISKSDIPNIDKTLPIKLQYSIKAKNDIEKIEKTEDFTIDAFKISKTQLKENKLNLVSKGEVIEESPVSLENLAGSDNVNGNKYLFLVSSNYIDSRDTNLRGILNIPNKDSFGKDLFANQEEIFIEDIQEEVNKSINTMYPEIEEVKQKHQDDFAKLKEMFLLDDEIAKDISVSINDSESKILEKFYEAEARKSASFDASIKESVDKLENLDTTKPTYQDELVKAVDKLVKTIPLQNKKALTHYVARRKLVLELFQKILNNETSKLKSGGRIDEDVLHNLIFQQSSNDPMNSDLWLVNEEYIYFRGVSEGLLGQIECDGSKILKENLSVEENEYRKKQGGDARLRRTDILLFPAEAKCIIIELKAPDANVSDHLNQINRYASLINNLSIDTLKFNTFYGYLVGESIDADDIIDNDSDFMNAPNLGYIFRPYKRIVGKFGRVDGSLYTEIIKYSTLLERAKLRNKIFIDKLK
ncbi:hypothetical protein [Flavobacterium marginilacus]|uniref:hypothetical protein n=1 Tax=Flavobacterium marginilacus TaxID=3003256 RepID=UPI00248D430D|nr:hypothetical protein [Flavobacterium marginilacus]